MGARKKGLGCVKASLKYQWKYDSEVHSLVAVNLNSGFVPLYSKCHCHMMQSTDTTNKIKYKTVSFAGSACLRYVERLILHHCLYQIMYHLLSSSWHKGLNLV